MMDHLEDHIDEFHGLVKAIVCCEGTARAMQVILLAEKIEAEELARLGVVVQVAAPERLREATLSIAREIEAGPPMAFAAIKRVLYANSGVVDDALKRERDEQLKLLRSADAMEGVMAWMQKREPRFHGNAGAA